MSARSLLVVACIGLASVARGQEDVPTAPLAGRPTRFSHLVGKFTVEASVAPESVAVETPTTLTVVVRGTPADGAAPKRESLRLFADDVEEAFFVEPAPESDRAEPGRWTFVWRLRPKSSAVSATPELSLVHYLPGVRRFQTATADPLPLRVTERPASQRPVRAVPDYLRAPASVGEGFTASMAAQRRDHAILFATLTATLFVVWLVARWRTAARVVDPATRALDLLASDPSRWREAVTDYFRERWSVSEAAPLGPAIEARLRRAGVSAAIREAWANCWSAWDARFAPEATSGAPDAVAVADLVRRTEADAWKR